MDVVVVVVVVDIAVVLFQRGVNFLWIDLRFETLTNIVLNSKMERDFFALPGLELRIASEKDERKIPPT